MMRSKNIAEMRSLLGGLRGDVRGATMVEFAFVAGPLVALLLATLQISLVYFAQQCLDSAAEQAERLLMTGSAQQSGMTQSQFASKICASLPAYMDCSKVMFDVQTAADFNSANASPPHITYDGSGNINNNWSFSPGAPGKITIARIMYVWEVSTTPLGFDISTLSKGKRLLVSTQVFKVEPYKS